MRPARGYCDYTRARQDCEDLFGEDAPLYPLGVRHPRDDMRGVSLRWLTGSFLTGVAGVMLMGGALYTANDSRTSFAATPQIMFAAAKPTLKADRDDGKGDRLIVRTALRPVAKEMMEVETSSRIGDREYIAVKPFLRLTTGLAMTRTDLTADLEPFNPLSVYAQGTDTPARRAAPDDDSDALLESAALVMSPLDDTLLSDDEADDAADMRDMAEIMAQVRQIAAFDTAPRRQSNDGVVRVASLSPSADPVSAGLVGTNLADTDLAGTNLAAANLAATAGSPGLTTSASAFAPLQPVSLGLDAPFDPLNQFGPTELDAYAAIVRPGLAENMTAVSKSGAVDDGVEENEQVIVDVRAGDTIASVLVAAGAGPSSSRLADTALELDALLPGDQIEIAFVPGDEIAFGPRPRLHRVSAFREGAHLGTVVASTAGAFLVVGVPDDVELAAPTRDGSGGTQLYASLYETTLKHGLPRELAEELVGIFTFDVNFRSAVTATDALNVFYEVDPITREPQDIVHASLTVGGTTHRYYRYELEDGTYGYFDEDGRSARKFLMRKPIASGKFRSPFGMRRHPVLRYNRMHNGIDYSAPRGTPIFAAGDGTVKKASWAGGYGNQVALRHANGYETTYSHMTRYASGIEPGVRVSQGQIIGYVGSTGLSTGPHLHYEVHVNSRPVDPMRIKVPRTVELSGDQLAEFEAEKARIDGLMRPDERIAQLTDR